MGDGHTIRLAGLGIATLALTGACGLAGHDEEPLDVKVLVARQRVEVFTREPGDCREDGEFRHEPGCRTDEWSFAPFKDCVAPSCATSFSLEVDGKAVTPEEPTVRSATFELSEPLEPGTSLVIEGCGDPIVLDLPEPKVDAPIDFDTTSESIDLEVGAKVAGTFAFASSLSLAKGYYAVCEASGTTSRLPVSQDYGFYAVGAFAFEEPEIVNNARVHAALYPSVYAETSVSTLTDVDALWQAALVLAKSSSLYEPCSSYCEAVAKACGGEGDPTDCAIGCVGAGEAFPACTDEYTARLGCWRQAAQCDPRATSLQSSPCEVEDAKWESCASD